GPVQSLERGVSFGGPPVDVVTVGGLEEGQIPLRILVTNEGAAVSVSSVVHATGTGTADPTDPSRLALLVTGLTVLPVAVFDLGNLMASVLGMAAFFGILMAFLGLAWERHAAALSEELREEEAETPEQPPAHFVASLLRGKNRLSSGLRMAFFAATGRALFVFGLIAFLYVYLTVYVIQAASVDWWVHHWVPWLRLDAFAALGLIAAFLGLFLWTFVQELRKRG
ncbi:MAG: hypothetical protein R3291_04085, partial [Thermoplasmata archaeon]|nr:hypothetical protein [Thermoplasmata archaeon]